MATKSKKPKSIEFPFKGDEAQNLRLAQRMARSGLKDRKFRVSAVLPTSLICAVLGGVVGRATRPKYFEAYLQELAAEELENANADDAVDLKIDGEDGLDASELAGLPARTMMFTDGYTDHVWRTEMAELKHKAGHISWREIPEDKITEIKSRRIPRSEWESWAVRFLLFASELSQLMQTQKSSKGGVAKAANRRQRSRR